MKKYNILTAVLVTGVLVFTACTKYGNGFISPYLQYAVNQFTITRGRVASSYTLNTDGSNIPLHVRWTHIYDSTGKAVDDIFLKTYPVAIWTAAYDPNTDKTYAAIMAKRSTANLPPIVVNDRNGTIEANPATINLPLGTYTMDLEVSNSAGTQQLKKIMTIIIADGRPLETAPEQGAFSLSLLVANTASGAGAAGGPNNGTLFNGVNNPFVDYTVRRLADTPNVLIIKVTDRNGVVFNPKTGEIAKRPNSGLNPNPPFLQNLQDYAPDTFVASDTAMTLRYPLTPFPIASLGNGFNMYYRLPAQSVRIDSTTAWTTNTAGNFYTGTTDSHYKGTYTNGKYDFALRIPMRIQVPGTYQMNIRLLNATHR